MRHTLRIQTTNPRYRSNRTICLENSPANRNQLCVPKLPVVRKQLCAIVLEAYTRLKAEQRVRRPISICREILTVLSGYLEMGRDLPDYAEARDDVLVPAVGPLA